MSVSGISSFQETMNTLKAERAGSMIRGSGERQLSVTILGAGPAGLIRAIESVMDNHRTQVIERRAAGEGNVNGRSNTVAINNDTMPILQRYGVYQWLLEQDLVYPYNEEERPYLSVRLKDLEQAMKAVLHELAPEEEIIHYERSVVEINTQQPKVAIRLSGEEWIRDIDILVNAEGARSSSNELLNIGRVEVLRKIPVIAAIFEDTRPSITGIWSFFVYIGKTIYQTAVSVYYYAIFFFKFIFQGERFKNPDRIIAGSLILKTPGQNYLGFGFTEEVSAELLTLHRRAEELQTEEAKDAYHSFVTYWGNLSFCRANFMAFLKKWFTYFGCYKGPESSMESAGRYPLKSFKITEIGADRTQVYQRAMGNSAYLISGDALATVDPTTGLGANTAIKTVSLFHDVMRGMKRGQPLGELLQNYSDESLQKIAAIHRESITFRRIYRPDAVSMT